MVHSEMPAEQGDSNGIQLWINLPKHLKKITPAYQQVDENDFPVENIEGGQVKILVGGDSPLELKSEVIYQHAHLNKQATYQLELNPAMRGIVYVMSGKTSVNQQPINADQAMFIEDINHLKFVADDDSQFMICMGIPHGEPIHQHGPFVD